MYISLQEQELCRHFRELPRRHNFRFDEAADQELREILFRSLAGRGDYFGLFFPNGPPTDTKQLWSLREAQGAVEGAEYTPAAKGKPCGHIFKNGEATYRCKTCTADDTCVLCARCFDASDHEGHQVYVSVSPGNSGCCDCGDDEAWVRPVHCNIHSPDPELQSKAAGKAREGSVLPDELLETIRITIARTLDYLIDVFSCSPEQLRLPKSEESILLDERQSRLTSKWYDPGDQPEECEEYCLVLWNDEKHTVNDVRDQVARACKQKIAFGLAKAYEINDVGRSAIVYRSDLQELLRMAKIIEEIKLTVTIRSARDTFREQMAGALIEWISDIAGCSVGSDNSVLRRTVCEELLKPWRVGSEATNRSIGKNGLDDHEMEDNQAEMDSLYRGLLPIQRRAQIVRIPRRRTDTNDDTTASDDDEEDDREAGTGGGDDMDIDEVGARDNDGDVDMDIYEDADEALEVSEATMAGYPPPPPPPSVPRREQPEQSVTPAESDSEPMGAPSLSHVEPMVQVPETPLTRTLPLRPSRPPNYWLEKPESYGKKPGTPAHEDLWQRLRLDHLILYDLRMWKQLRIGIRDVFISTVVTIPEFKRLLGLRFAGVYTALAQLYLIADREPDHSIINLSLQMLTTPSITSEVVERGNFLTNLMAILYTFLTTRQVGYPSNVDSKATLAFEQGAVTNRRMYHFFLDMKYLLGSEFVQERIRDEQRYLLQFLDLVKLHQGICPNVRAVGEHLEFESEAWISASLITREINKLCRHFADSFAWSRGQDATSIRRAIRAAAKVVTISSLGAERHRFDQTELKEETKFKTLGVLEFDAEPSTFFGPSYKVVDYVVAKEPMSFHHALHYTLSWLLDKARSMPQHQILQLLLFSHEELQADFSPATVSIPLHEPQEYLLALFDFPLRVCAWLAQMRAGIWVRNGITLRHQMTQYRSVSQRDVSHQRDIFLLQSALVLCNPSVFLATMIDRYGLTGWMTGKYEASQHGFEDTQAIDLVEDFIHLLIIILSERTSLIPLEENTESHLTAMRRDIAHVLCFKPLSYSDMTARLSDRVQNMDEFPAVLSEMTRFRAPEGLSDSGTFELKEQYLDLIDPYLHQYNRNQREEAETTYKSYVAKKTGKKASDIVYEPKLRPIPSGLFQDLSAFTRTPLFTQIIYYLLGYGLRAAAVTPNIPATRVETYIQFALQLLLVAVLEDKTEEHDWSQDAPDSFITSVLTKHANMGIPEHPTVLSVLKAIQEKEIYKGCESKINLIMHRLKQRQQNSFIIAAAALNMPTDRMDTASPFGFPGVDKELKKKQALERQAKVMAAFKEQQGKFMENQDFDWGEDDFSDLEDETGGLLEQEKTLKYPSGTCILCQEDTDEHRLYGTFAYVSESRLLRQTNVQDDDWVEEVAQTPVNLDRSADDLRPFGVSGKNRRTIEKITATGERITTERQDLGKGFPHQHVKPGPITTGCGHIMHYNCFEVYLQATQRRHVSQIARNHPERPELKEFMCPLCKAVGNMFLPVIWKAKQVVHPGVLGTKSSFDDWLQSELVATFRSTTGVAAGKAPADLTHDQKVMYDYGDQDFVQPLASRLPDLLNLTHIALAVPQTTIPQPPRFTVPAFLGVPQDESQLPGAAASEGSPSVVQNFPMLELLKVYQRLKDTLRANAIDSSFAYPYTPASAVEDLTHTDSLAQALGNSIAAAEIAQRGVQSDSVRGTLIDKMSTQTLTHLRVFSETVSSYIAVGSLRNNVATKTMEEYTECQRRQSRQLFVGHPGVFDPEELSFDLKAIAPLLCQDPFIFLSECAIGIVRASNLDIHHIMRLCYLAEIVRVVNVFAPALKQEPGSGAQFQHPERFINADKVNNGFFSPDQLNNLLFFVCVVHNISTMGDSPASLDIDNMPIPEHFKDPNFLYFIHTMVSSYALPFLRKAAILLHIRYGVDLPSIAIERAEESEVVRLSTLLKIPSLDEIFASFASRTPAAHTTRSVVGGWLRHLLWVQAGKGSLKPTISLSHPAIFELVGLPKNYDTLTDEAIRRKCPTTGKELTDPALCLFCGEIMCSQAVCCMTDKHRGGCNQHLAKCGGQIGLFIHIRKCMVLFLNLDHGTWSVAPYLDKHGEVDPTLRRHHQLFLNQKRYDALLRKVWLEGGVQSMIARRLEGDINNGGWESL